MMKRNSIHSMLSVLLCVVLIAALALFAAGCAGSATTPETPSAPDAQQTPSNPETPSDSLASDLPLNVLGEGATTFSFSVVNPDGSQVWYEIHTDETVVGKALMALELIDGEEGPYGLYVKTVCGTTLDYEKDGKYWAFYIDDEYGLTGVDVTDITPGAAYAFKAE